MHNLIKRKQTWFLACENCDKYYLPHKFLFVHIRKLGTNLFTKHRFWLCNICRKKLFGNWKDGESKLV